MHDAISLVQRGIAAVAIITEPFVPTAQAVQTARGAREPWFVVMPHPLVNLTPEEVQERVAALTEPVVDRLLRALAEIHLGENG